jgi:hypothetical protein
MPLAQVLDAASAKFLHRRRSTYRAATVPTYRPFLSAAVRPMALSQLPALDGSSPTTLVYEASPNNNRVPPLLPPGFLHQ